MLTRYSILRIHILSLNPPRLTRAPYSAVGTWNRWDLDSSFVMVRPHSTCARDKLSFGVSANKMPGCDVSGLTMCDCYDVFPTE